MRKIFEIVAPIVFIFTFGLANTYAQDIRIPLSGKHGKKTAADTLDFVPKSMSGDYSEIIRHIKKDIAVLSSDSLKGRYAGTPGEMSAARYIYKRLSDDGLELLSPLEGDDFYITAPPFAGAVSKDTIHSRNIAAVVQGYDAKLKNQYIVIAAHYDGMGVNDMTVDGRSVEQIYRGADANASGVACLLALAKQIRSTSFLFKRSVLFLFTGADEQSLAGTWCFLNRSFKNNVKDISMMINLDMVGRDDSGMGFSVFTSAGNNYLRRLVAAVSSNIMFPSPGFIVEDGFPSSHRLFYEAGIPSLLFTTGLNSDYHSARDVPGLLDYDLMMRITGYVYSFANAAACTEKKAERIKHNPKSANASAAGGQCYSQFDVDERATFMHGDEKAFLNRWVYKYMKYPERAVKDRVSGVVEVQFVINKDGNVSDVKITHSVSPEIDAEVLKVVSASPKWMPAMLKGTPVKVRTSIPVYFRLKKSSSIKLKK
ncbi:MAG: TonB family protein [Bacteroidales bacterium]|jgi:TonB family protein|nr:TonB family protein [Bacteroidales bacterium]